LALIWVTLPDVLDQYAHILSDAYDLIGQMLKL